MTLARKPGLILRALALWIAALAIMPASGCSAFNSVSQSLFMMSPEEEVQLGPKVAAEIEKDVKFVRDPEINAYIQEVGAKIAAASPKTGVPPHFFVVEDKEINAFAIPGGNCYIQTGLINAADDEAELAAVVAHEIGHVVNRHGVKSMSRQTGMSVLSQIAVGTTKSGQAGQILGGLVANGAMFKYSRQDELEADATAVGTLNRMGYDPGALATFFEKLTKKYGDNSGMLKLMFATHPPNSERIKQVNDLKAQLASGNARQYERPVTALRRAQARLAKLGLGPQP